MLCPRSYVIMRTNKMNHMQPAAPRLTLEAGGVDWFSYVFAFYITTRLDDISAILVFTSHLMPSLQG